MINRHFEWFWRCKLSKQSKLWKKCNICSTIDPFQCPNWIRLWAQAFNSFRNSLFFVCSVALGFCWSMMNDVLMSRSKRWKGVRCLIRNIFKNILLSLNHFAILGLEKLLLLRFLYLEIYLGAQKTIRQNFVSLWHFSLFISSRSRGVRSA